MLKKLYIAVVKFIGAILGFLGLFKFLSKYPQNQTALYIRSVFAIYDFEKMAALDLPWWNFKAIAEVEAFLQQKQNAKVFEFGSGASTIWLSKRAGKVISVEYDKWFYEKLQGYVADNVELVLRPPKNEKLSEFGSLKKGFHNKSFEEFVREIDNYGKFDLIIIDGRAREKCFEHALEHLNEDGIILFDDTHRLCYMAMINATKNVQVISYKGLTPSLIYPNQTSLIRK